jgi:hypothetical protein
MDAQRPQSDATTLHIEKSRQLLQLLNRLLAKRQTKDRQRQTGNSRV